MEKKLEEDKKYFDNYEENRIELEKKIKESKILNDKLINKNKKIIKELDNKKELINKYESELDKLNYEHNQKVKEISNELNNKGISINKLNTLNNEYKQIIQELENKLNYEKLSLDEYKKRLNTSNDSYEKEIQKLKEELKKSKEYVNRDKKDNNEVLKKISELTEENQKHIKEKQIIEQELNKKQQELNKKEQKLANNKIIINDSEYQIKLLKDKKNDELKKSEAKIKISDKIKVFEDSSTPTKIPQSVRKRDNKVKTFAPKDSKIDSLLKDFEINSLLKFNNDLNRSESLENEYQKIYIPNLSELLNIERDPTKLKELDVEQIERNLKDGEFYEYELNVSNSRIKYLDKIIKENTKISAEKKI